MSLALTLNDELAQGNDAIVNEAHREFRKAKQIESEARQRWRDDYKFANADAYNNFQWPDAIYQTRGDRPSLTVNETRQHNLHITNEAKQNKSGVKYRPVGDGATADAAEAFEGLYRHIANISSAQMAQGMAIDFQVQAGLGFTVVDSGYVDQKSFDQEIFIKSVPNPLGCYLCNSTELDGSDATAGFIFTDKPRAEVEKKYPQLKDRIASTNGVDDADAGWLREDYVREADYYKVIEEHDELLGDDDGNIVLRSLVPARLVKRWEQQAEDSGGKLKRRPVVTKQVKRYKIVGDICADETDIPGTSVPIVPWVGEVTTIDDRLDRKGHTRCMIGAQQMLNYNWSASVEFGALQTKIPYEAPAAAIAGYETYWFTANTQNHSVLPWNHVDDQGNPIPKPERAMPPQASSAYLEGIKAASQFMMTSSGQYAAELGQPGNERSGKAINERQRQSDRATYHFTDNQAMAIRRQGQLILEWAPVIYDTNRVLQILGIDGKRTDLHIDPGSPQAHEMRGAMRVLNPSVGRYEVVSDVGPDYATQRQEAFDAIIQIITQAPQLIPLIGDLLFRVADFPMADQIAERLKPGLPPAAQQAVTALQTQLHNNNRLLGEVMQALAEERIKAKNRDADATVKAFDADTRRLTAVKDALPLDPEMLRQLVREEMRQALQDNLGPIRGDLARSFASDINPAGGDQGSGQLPVRVPNVGQQLAMNDGAVSVP
jgi:Phage P22-like portal protein